MTEASAGGGIERLTVVRSEDAAAALSALGVFLRRGATVEAGDGRPLVDEVEEFRNSAGLTPAPDETTFAVCVATYHRADGSTLAALERTRASLRAQREASWHLILVGDDYSDAAELRAFAASMEGRCTCVNLPVACERDYIADRRQRWCVAGGTAMNTALFAAREWGYRFYAHLDDDDTWSPAHLSALREGYSLHPEVDVCYTSGTFLNGAVLPTVSRALPVPYDTLHACVSWRLGPGRATDAYTYDLSRTGTPADARMWQRFMADARLVGLHADVVTVSKSNNF